MFPIQIFAVPFLFAKTRTWIRGRLTFVSIVLPVNINTPIQSLPMVPFKPIYPVITTEYFKFLCILYCFISIVYNFVFPNSAGQQAVIGEEEASADKWLPYGAKESRSYFTR